MNGLELIERLRIQNLNCMVIVISGHDEFAYAQQAVRLDECDYLLKPVQKQELRHVVDKVLDMLQKVRLKQKQMQ
ncbi:response regulator [Paenibacillus sp. N3.4]|uniref:response regulator n=1 Tax=Paenibacillus sp. N3.4 TaxID=2603222 RepID=UPI0011C89929|nr:response regulator [Paenibacillus sp. N3.4]TXK85055.1 response regulator [Paenibacillus sp. N3.4]